MSATDQSTPRLAHVPLGPAVGQMLAGFEWEEAVGICVMAARNGQISNGEPFVTSHVIRLMFPPGTSLENQESIVFDFRKQLQAQWMNLREAIRLKTGAPDGE